MDEAVPRQISTDAPDVAENGPIAAAVACRAVAPQLVTLSASERRLRADWLDRVVADMSHDHG